MNDPYANPMSFNGIPIRSDTNVPEFTPCIELSNKVGVSAAFRVEFNAWLLSLFGRKRTIYMIAGTMVTHPRTVQALKIATKKFHLFQL